MPTELTTSFSAALTAAQVQLWFPLRAEAYDDGADNVSTLNDRSGNARDFTTAIVSGGSPSYVETFPRHALFDSADFDAFGAATSGHTPGTKNFWAVWVGQTEADAVILSAQSPGTARLRVNAGTKTLEFNDGTTTVSSSAYPAASADVQIFSIRRVGGVVTFTADAVAGFTTPTDRGGGTAAGSVAELNRFGFYGGGGSGFWKGKLHDFFICDTAPDAATRLDIMTKLLQSIGFIAIPRVTLTQVAIITEGWLHARLNRSLIAKAASWNAGFVSKNVDPLAGPINHSPDLMKVEAGIATYGMDWDAIQIDVETISVLVNDDEPLAKDWIKTICTHFKDVFRARPAMPGGTPIYIYRSPPQRLEPDGQPFSHMLHDDDMANWAPLKDFNDLQDVDVYQFHPRRLFEELGPGGAYDQNEREELDFAKMVATDRPFAVTFWGHEHIAAANGYEYQFVELPDLVQHLTNVYAFNGVPDLWGSGAFYLSVGSIPYGPTRAIMIAAALEAGYPDTEQGYNAYYEAEITLRYNIFVSMAVARQQGGGSGGGASAMMNMMSASDGG